MATPAPTPASSSAQLHRSNFPYSGRLIVLESGHTTGFDPFAGLSSFVAINFPMMPENGIELTRSVEYLVVNSQVMPDGIHQYKSTMPLNIPISFKLHSFDKEYCPQGALSLLQLAALLHSFSLPLTNTSGATPLTVTVGQSQPQAKPNGDTSSLENQAQSASSPYNVTPQSGADFFPPVTLRLELIFVDENNPGIICTGYVKDVRVNLIGPYLRGPNRSYNLPTAAEFGFTFVHVPGYGNNFSISKDTAVQSATMGQAFAGDVKKKLFNTIDITRVSDRSFKGFNP
jgi:hypothetical protein